MAFHKSNRNSLARQEERLFYLFISPWLLGFLVLTCLSMAASLYWSFTEYDMLTSPKWIGLENYQSAFSGFDSRLFWQALKVTLIYTFSSVPLQLVGGFLVAILMNQQIKGINVFRTIYYLPSITAGVATAMLWLFIFNPQFGILNWLLAQVGIEGPAWLASRKWALPALIMMSMWGFGGPMVIYLAGLQGIPQHLYEAAKIDGANAFKQFLYVTIPQMTPIIFFNLVMSIIGTFQVFTSAFVMTAGGPVNATLFYVLYLYREAFQSFRMGYASALAWVLFIIIMIFTGIQVKLSGKWVYYEGIR